MNALSWHPLYALNGVLSRECCKRRNFCSEVTADAAGAAERRGVTLESGTRVLSVLHHGLRGSLSCIQREMRWPFPPGLSRTPDTKRTRQRYGRCEEAHPHLCSGENSQVVRQSVLSCIVCFKREGTGTHPGAARKYLPRCRPRHKGNGVVSVGCSACSWEGQAGKQERAAAGEPWLGGKGTRQFPLE